MFHLILVQKNKQKEERNQLVFLHFNGIKCEIKINKHNFYNKENKRQNQLENNSFNN